MVYGSRVPSSGHIQYLCVCFLPIRLSVCVSVKGIGRCKVFQYKHKIYSDVGCARESFSTPKSFSLHVEFSCGPIAVAFSDQFISVCNKPRAVGFHLNMLNCRMQTNKCTKDAFLCSHSCLLCFCQQNLSKQ